MQNGYVVFAFAAPLTGNRALCRDVICLCLPTALVSPGAPSVELVPLALPCDMYSKQHMEATLLGYSTREHRVTHTVQLMCIPSSQCSKVLLSCILQVLYTAKPSQSQPHRSKLMKLSLFRYDCSYHGNVKSHREKLFYSSSVHTVFSK